MALYSHYFNRAKEILEPLGIGDYNDYMATKKNIPNQYMEKSRNNENTLFGLKGISIRTLNRSDLDRPKMFQEYINNLIKEKDSAVTFKKLKTLEEEKLWVKNSLALIRAKKMIIRIAEYEGRIIAEAAVALMPDRRNHVGEVGISVVSNFRNIGLGSHLLSSVILAVPKELKPKPEILRLSTVATNKDAISFYKKFGFKKVASIPKQFAFGAKKTDEIVMILNKLS